MKNIIGFENLPNAFIKRIDIHNSEHSNSYVAMLRLCVKDHKMSDGNWSWYDDQILKDNLSILCVMCYNPEIIASINNGEITLSPKELVNHPSYQSGDIKIKSVPISIKKFKQGLGPGLHSLIYRVKFEIESVPFNEYGGSVAVFAATHIDFAKMANQIGGSVPKEYSVFHGPIQSDYIFQSGKILDTSIIYSNDGFLYAGPTHEHNGVIMAGSKHTDMPHPTLQENVVENLKIKDYTKFNDVAIKEDTNKYFKIIFLVCIIVAMNKQQPTLHSL